MKIKKILTENLGVKLIALVVAVFIWFNASGQQEVARIRTIPLVVENLPDSLTITGRGIPSQVEISVRGTKRQLLTMGFKRVHLVIDLTGAEPGRQRVTLTSNHIRLPGGIDRRQVSVISPGNVDLNLESIVSKRVEVALATTGAVPDHLVLMGETIRVEPTHTTIRGAATRVAKITSVSTEPLDLDLGRARSPFERELALMFDRDRYTCDPDHVTVTAVVNERGQRVLANVPPTVLVDSDDYVARVFPSTVSLTLEGASPVLDTLSSGDVSVLLNLSGRPPDRYRLAPDVILPAGVVLAGMSVDTLTVQISRSGDAGAP
jgi:YbbR domain-containing protein